MTAAPEPVRPVLAASAAIFRDGRVLLAARGQEPLAGLFSLPGGRVEPGETLAEAARREALEETGLAVGIVGLAHLQEVIGRDPAGDLAYHVVVCAFAARWQGGEARASEEAPDLRWVDRGAIGTLPTTDGLADAVERAWLLLQAEPPDGSDLARVAP